jgi:hypothetical protein
VIDSFSDAEERIEARVNKSDVYELVGTEIKEPCLVRSFET